MEGPLQEGPRLADRLEALDKEIRAWGRITRSQLVGQILSLNLEGRANAAIERQRSKLTKEDKKDKVDPLHETVNYHTRRRGGEIEKVSLRFAAHGIFIDRGVGRGRPVGSAEANAAARPWLAPILPQAVEALADRVAEGYADIVALEASIRIPGILETKIR